MYPSSAMPMKRLVATLLTLVGILAIPVAQAGIPGLLSYQARLLDSRGVPLDGNFDLGFTLYDAEADGEMLWSEPRNLTIVNGVLDVMLGEVQKLNESAFDAEELWLEVQVPDAGFSFPRVRITPTSFAFRVKSLEGSHGGTVTGGTTFDGAISVVGPTTMQGVVTTENALNVGGELNLPNGIQLLSTNGSLSIISGASTITIDPTGSITIRGDADLSLLAGGDLPLEGANVDITASANCTIQGGAGAEISSGGVTVVQGSLVEIN